MRIGDAVNFSTDRLEGNRLFLYTQKTGVPVNTILPEFVLSALEATPKVTDTFFFWSGRGKLESIVRSWQTRLRKLFKLANVPNGHAHRFRDYSLSNCFSPVCPLNEFRYCWAIKV